MEQMDFTMESEQPANLASRCPYFHQMSRPVNHVSHRDGPPNYDPTSSRDSRYANSTSMNTQQRPTYSSNMPHLPHMPPQWGPDSWYGFGQLQQHQPQYQPQQQPQQHYHHQHYTPHHQPSRSADVSNSRPPFLAGGWSTASSNHQSPFGFVINNPAPGIPHSGLDRSTSDSTGPVEANDGRMPASAAPTSAPQPFRQSAIVFARSNQPTSDSNNAPTTPSEGSTNAQNRSTHEPMGNRVARITPAGRLGRNSLGVPSEEVRAPQFRPTRGNPHHFSSAARRSRGLSHGSSDADADDDDSDDHSELYHREIYLSDETALATMRGLAAHGKLVASQSAIASLEKVEVKSLAEADRTCIICYNEFSIENPEGIVESPLRLPKCKHIFGDKCIKKWFQDSDSCPYCRDKLPSESSRPRMLLARLNEQQAMRSSRMNLTTISARHLTSDEHATGLRTRDLASYQADYLAVQQGLAEQRNPPYVPNRPLYPESPESRRRRGRLGVGRALPPPNRPTSVGTTRFNMQQGLFRNVLSGPTQIQMSRNHYTSRDNPHTNIPNGHSASSSPEGLSPPVAVGSSPADSDLVETASHASENPDESQSHSQWHDSAIEFLTRDEHNNASQRPVINNTESHGSPPPRLLPPHFISIQQQYSPSENSLPRTATDSGNSIADGAIWIDPFTTVPRIAPFQQPRWSGWSSR